MTKNKKEVIEMLHFYRKVTNILEYCFNVETEGPLNVSELKILKWLLAETFEPEKFDDLSFLGSEADTCDSIVELGPRLNFATAWNTNAVAICHACGLDKVVRIERSRRYLLFADDNREKFIAGNHDPMTECEYPKPLETFETSIKPEQVFLVPLMKEGQEALRKINKELGLGMDDWDIAHYFSLFINNIGRNPTNVECFQLGQANSEHSRHHFFKGELVIDGEEMPYSLMDIVKMPLRLRQLDTRAKEKRDNSVIAFNDNSSGIRGYNIVTIIPKHPGKPSRFSKRKLTYHIIFTAETHNFPTGVAPFPGAETGTGGRIRDIQATGRGGLVVAGTAAYCVGNLHIPGYELPWEDKIFKYPSNLASPRQIEIKASDGASDYGNKFGEPVIQGFTRSFGLRLPDGERREWVKPIMFTGGVGQIDSRHTEKGEPEKGMLIVQIGGPAYRIGMGGGSASSMIQGQNVAELDYNAVQRGDAEMEQKMNRVIRACVEMGDKNPIINIHDQGAGGPCNVITELINPAGGYVNIRKIKMGDGTLSVMEIWGAEYQERNALLIREDRIIEFVWICRREKVECEVLGEITGSGRIRVIDSRDNSLPVDLELSKILGKMPRKIFHDETIKPVLKPLELPEDLTVREALERVLKLVSVGSKRFLISKVDRSVTGLIVQQQCVGPSQLTLSNVAVISQSHFPNEHGKYSGAAISIGEQPIKGLINPAAMARMSVGEALTNLVWAKVSAPEDIKISANWMWAAKLPGEAARMYEAATALRDILIKLGIAIDGGKDSLSMAAKVPLSDGNTELVKSPRTLVISAYCTMSDITKVVTPDIKKPGESVLLYLNFSGPFGAKKRLGGSSLAQVYGQIGNAVPDIDHPWLLKNGFIAVQELIEKDLILAGHDISDGGLIVTLLEMAFAGNCGLKLDIKSSEDMLYDLFHEEAGVIIEIERNKLYEVIGRIRAYGIPCPEIGLTQTEKQITVFYNGNKVLDQDMRILRSIWEETSYQLDRLQKNPQCADEEKKNIYNCKGINYNITFPYKKTSDKILRKRKKPKVAVIREEGSNGDREMTSAFFQAGFEVWDVTMTDLLSEKADLADFRGVVFVGGFSYADVLDSAKGWTGVIRFNEKLRTMFDEFYNRPDTFSLGVCNGCQLMALLGWVPFTGLPDSIKPRFIQNKSGRFESRFVTVKILESPAIMLRGMENSVLGVWVAHGEGRVYFPNESWRDEALRDKLTPMRYVDDEGYVTEQYPFNPNGSSHGITALCSPDGRHLAMMPHPERSFLKWQWPYQPEGWRNEEDQTSPWLKIFQNARIWCEEVK